MPKQIQWGELASRARRMLGLRGPIPMSLDELVSPVAIVGDASDLPYSLDPLSWGISLEVTGGAAELSTTGITNEGPEGSIVLVEQVVISVATGDTRVELSRSGIKQTAVAPLATKFAADLSSKCQGLSTALDTPIIGSTWNVDITTVGSVAQIIRAAIAPLVVPVKFLLRRGETMYAKTLTDNIRLTCSFSGRYWSNIADS